MLYLGGKFKNEEYRKKALKSGLSLSSTIPHSKVVLIVNDVFDPMYGYYEGDKDKAVETKNVFCKERKKLKSLVNPEVIVKKWPNTLTTPLK